ncbi:MAG TPA: response regulator transcription factor [Actinomycetota bacterium]|jgi:DNA-binding response OmpR family regulator
MPTVLIVDDDPDVQMFLQIALDAAGFTTITADNGREAVEAITERQPDVVVLDIMMPVVDGWSALAEVRQAGISPPVIVMTAKADGQTRERAQQLGVEGFMTKPFSPNELLQRVEEIVRHANNPLAIRIG